MQMKAEKLVRKTTALPPIRKKKNEPRNDLFEITTKNGKWNSSHEEQKHKHKNEKKKHSHLTEQRQ